MNDALLMLPDFLLILGGWALCRFGFLDRTLWAGVERLVYHVLFPALLFASIVRQPLQASSAFGLVGSVCLLTACGIALAGACRPLAKGQPLLHASGAQVAFRFNSYVALALSERLAGAAGVAWMALVVSVCVPLCNVAAVWPLARQGGQRYLGELARNPLIQATVGGLAFNLLGLPVPDIVHSLLSRMGSAALPLGLMAVGAGLQFGALALAPALAAALLSVRHAVLPAVGLALALWVPLEPSQRSVVVAFSALPTASSAYVLAVRMGGHGPFVAGLVTLSTLLAMAGLPLTIALLRALG